MICLLLVQWKIRIIWKNIHKVKSYTDIWFVKQNTNTESSCPHWLNLFSYMYKGYIVNQFIKGGVWEKYKTAHPNYLKKYTQSKIFKLSGLFVCLFVCLMVVNATFNTISAVSFICGQEDPEKTTASHGQTLSHVFVLNFICVRLFAVGNYYAIDCLHLASSWRHVQVRVWVLLRCKTSLL
jgi:hypothetical protein